MKYSYDEVFQSAYDYFKDEIATNVWIEKYAMQDQDGFYLEKSPKDMFKRMSQEFARIERQYNELLNTEEYNSLSEFGKSFYKNGLTEDKIYNLFDGFQRIIPQGSVMSQLGHKHSLGSLSNCTVVNSPHDSYNGIIMTDLELANLFKRRAGVGVDISTLRPDGASVTNTAKTSTGGVSFMERYSNTTKEVAQFGRRGALMLSCDIKYVNVDQFAIIKNNETKVTGANISIRLTDEFMNAVENDLDYLQCFPIDADTSNVNLSDLQYNVLVKKDGIYLKKVKARTLWNIIIKSARNHAEPGLIYWDRQHKYSPSSIYPEYKNISTNPCVVGDTLVLTSIGLIKIKNLKNYPNVKIITQNKHGKLYASALEWVDITKHNDDIFEVTLSNGEKLRVNKTHKFYLAQDFSDIEVQNIKIGDEIIGMSNILNITDIQDLHYTEDVYDLTANPNYNFFSLYGYDEYIISDGIPVEMGIDIQIFNAFDIIVEGSNRFAYSYIDDTTFIDKHGKFLNLIQNSILNVDCSEIAMGANDSCRLIATNMTTHVINPFLKDASFDFQKWYETNYYGLVLNDDLVDLEVESIDRILNKIENDNDPEFLKSQEIRLWKNFKEVGQNGRRTGLGFTGLGDTIASLGYKYGSDESLVVVEQIVKMQLQAILDATIDLSILRGGFKGYDSNIEEQSEYIQMLKQEFNETYQRMVKHGRRNISFSTVAPTGSVSLLANNITSGIEPLFSAFYTRRKKINSSDDHVRVDFVDKEGVEFQEFNICHPNFKKWILTQDAKIDVENIPSNELQKWFEKSPYFKSTAHDIHWEKRVKLQALVQKYISHSISSTCNLPENVSEDTVSKVYMEAWKQGCKGITVYRDGSRSGILIKNEGKDTSENVLNEFFDDKGWVNFRNAEKIIKVHAPKRPTTLPCEIYTVTAKGTKWTVLVSLLKGEPYEVWAFMNGDMKYKRGVVKKNKKANYSLISESGDMIIPNLIDLMSDEEENLTLQISLSLRTGADIKYVVHALNKSKGTIVSFAKAIARTLSKYVKLNEEDVSKLDKKCPSCGDPDGLIYEGACVKCKSCGYGGC